MTSDQGGLLLLTRLPAMILCILTIASIQIVSLPAQAQDDDVRAQIEEIKKKLSEMDALKARLEELERKLEESQKAGEPELNPVSTSFKNVKARVDGRIFAGVFGTGDQGPYPNWSGTIPDARLRLTFKPSDRITTVMRLRADNAQTNGWDYLYVDYSGILGPISVVRVGQRKIDVGQQTWVDNPEENILITTSVSGVSGYGTGVALDGRIGKTVDTPLYEVGFVNGPRGVMVRPTSSLPFNIKLGAPFSHRWFASASYFNSGRLGSSDESAISVADLTTAPAGAVQWQRKLWELDLRYNYGPSGTLAIIPSVNLPKMMFGATYGQFNDSPIGTAPRKGSYWFVEGLYNITRKTYAAARYSTVGLIDQVLANLGGSPTPVNSYTRTSLGLGYRLSDLTDVKTEYSINETTGGTSEPSLNQWAVGVASKF